MTRLEHCPECERESVFEKNGSFAPVEKRDTWECYNCGAIFDKAPWMEAGS